MKALKRVTYVEDDEDICCIAQIALADIGGFDLQICRSGAEALTAAPGFKPDLILLDVMMPEMDGMETFRRLKEIDSLSETPVAFVTAKAQQHEVRSYMDLGAVAVVAKPFDPITLPDRLHAIWGAVTSGQST
ncbi:MAG: response regulator [Inquilinaceae bacterium]